MRRTFNDLDLTADYGAALGWDFTAEHEWGIKGLKQAFGIPELSRKKYGPACRTVTQVPQHGLYLIDRTESDHYLIFDRYANPKAAKISQELNPIGNSGDDGAAWSDGDFGIRSKNRDKLRELYEALKSLDMMIFLGGGQGPFSNAGLCLVIKSKAPEDLLEEMTKTDLDYLDLQDAIDMTNIKETLKKAGCKYYGLRGEWSNDDSTELKFWLNPQDQRLCQAGWYSLDELKAWTKGEGPVLEKGNDS